MVCAVFTVSCGQEGVQLGDAVWRQYCAEHRVLAHGKNPDTSDGGSCRCFLEETKGVLLAPRNLSLDLEANVINNITKGTLANLFHHELLLNCKEDAANKFASGHYTVRKDIIDKVNDRMRKLVTRSVAWWWYMIGIRVLGSLILDRMAVDLKFIQMQQLVVHH